MCECGVIYIYNVRKNQFSSVNSKQARRVRDVVSITRKSRSEGGDARGFNYKEIARSGKGEERDACSRARAKLAEDIIHGRDAFFTFRKCFGRHSRGLLARARLLEKKAEDPRVRSTTTTKG